ncbi:MAG: transglutaminase-like domain-containing protein [Kibdelosporangium sp.]
MSFTQPGVMTSAGRYESLFDGLPQSVAGLAAIGHGLVIHEHIAPAYGVELSEQDRASVHLRHLERLLGEIVAGDPRPLDVPREPAARTAGNCRHFTVLMVAMLRAQGFPARARCGFGNYFGTDFHEDHWVAEYWNAGQKRWILVDAQIDEVQLAMFPIDFDLTDVPRDRFLVGADAWDLCRAGKADPDKFGLSFVPEGGLWWVAANMMRDAAALANVEMLPWDVWGAMPEPESEIDVEFFDHLAALTRDPDAHLAEIRQLGEHDPRLRVPPKVYNAARGVDEAL